MEGPQLTVLEIKGSFGLVEFEMFPSLTKQARRQLMRAVERCRRYEEVVSVVRAFARSNAKRLVIRMQPSFRKAA